MMTRWHLSVT